MKASVIAVIAGALAAAVNGVPIIDNSNKAVTQAVQARAASGVAVAHGIIHGVGPHRFDHIHGPPVANITSSKKPGIIDIIRPSVSFQDAHTQTEMPSGKKSGVIDIIRPSVSFQDVHTQTEMPTSVSFQTASTLTQNLEIKTCVIRYNPNSGASFNDCPGQSSDDIRMERTQMPGMPTKSISMSTPATNTAHSTSTRVGNVEWIEWYLLCSGDFFGWVPTQCATMTPYAPGPEPSLMLTTDSTALTAINKKTSSTEAEPTLMLTTDSTALTAINKKTSSTEAEPTLMLTTDSTALTAINKKTSSTEAEPTLMLTTDSTALTAINKKTSSTEAEPTLMLTTDSTALTAINKKTSSTEAEPTLMLTTDSTALTAINKKTSSTEAEPTLMLTTDSTALTAINKKTSSTEAEPTLMLTTDSTALAVIDKKTSSTEAEPTLMLTTIASMITPTPTEEEATPNTSTSTVTETEDPIIEYTFAKVAKSLIVTRLG